MYSLGAECLLFMEVAAVSLLAGLLLPWSVPFYEMLSESHFPGTYGSICAEWNYTKACEWEMQQQKAKLGVVGAGVWHLIELELVPWHLEGIMAVQFHAKNWEHGIYPAYAHLLSACGHLFPHPPN